VYFYGGIAKINKDWLFGEPIRGGMPENWSWLVREGGTFFFAMGGLLFDLFVGVGLLSSKLRPVTALFVLYFHSVNYIMLSIGIFPLLMVATTILYFEPTNVRSLMLSLLMRLLNIKRDTKRTSILARVLRPFSPVAPTRNADSNSPSNTNEQQRSFSQKEQNNIDFCNKLITWCDFTSYHISGITKQHQEDENEIENPLPSSQDFKHPTLKQPSTKRRIIILLLLLYMAFQVVFPLRHVLWLHVGDPHQVHWTEEGHRFSWHMKLRFKHSFGYYIIFDAKNSSDDPCNQRDAIPYYRFDARRVLRKDQFRKMAYVPEMIWQFSKYYIHDIYCPNHLMINDCRVYCMWQASLNDRPNQWLIDPTVDLAHEEYPIWTPVRWVVPLNETAIAGTLRHSRTPSNAEYRKLTNNLIELEHKLYSKYSCKVQ